MVNPVVPRISCSERAFNYLSSDTNLTFLGAIEPEISAFKGIGSSEFGQSSLTHISDTG